MSSITGSDERTPGSLSAAISRLIVRLFAEYTGRGPTKARTTIRDNVVVCIAEDNMTKAERRHDRSTPVTVEVGIRGTGPRRSCSG
jgi:uncharacterized protein YbcI